MKVNKGKPEMDIESVLCLINRWLKEKYEAEYFNEYRINNQETQIFVIKIKGKISSKISDSINISLSKFVFINGKQ